ncbi:MAG: hypothetical protein ACK5LY_05355 [Lachnospirales bacterium]
MNFVKIIALSFTFISSFNIIKSFGVKKKKEVLELISYSKLLEDLYLEVNIFSTPIIKSLKKSMRSNKMYNKIFEEFEIKWQESDVSVESCFNQILIKNIKKLHFSKNNEFLFLELYKVFTFLDRKNLENHITYLQNLVNKEIKFLEKNAREDELLFKKLSLLGALATVVVLI